MVPCPSIRKKVTEITFFKWYNQNERKTRSTKQPCTHSFSLSGPGYTEFWKKAAVVA